MKHSNETIYDQKAFAQWLLGEPSDKTYDFLDIQDCLFARWLKHIGVATFVNPVEEGVGGYYFKVGGIDYDLPEWFSERGFNFCAQKSREYKFLQQYISNNWSCVKGETV